MIPDDPDSLDPGLLAALVAADEAIAAGREPGLAPGEEPGEAEALVSLIRRLGHARPPEEFDATTPPARLGKFEIEGVLGQGGFGIVYLARDPTLGRKVALKVPRPEVLIGPEVRRRFLREARAAAVLDHPNLVAVHEAGEAGPVCYIASAYFAGPSLSAWLRSRTSPVGLRTAARLVADLAGAVAHAHQRGVLHRDIKPGNVVLGFVGRGPGTTDPDDEASIHPRLTDFGLARLADDLDEETRTGTPLGSPPYMAPEQAAGRRAEVGPASDVYALGATLYELLTGRPPFRGETWADTIRMVIDDECVAPRLLRSGLPRDLETICLKSLEKTPTRRYATAEALRDDLERHLAGEPILARPASSVERLRRWARRRPGRAAGLAAGIVATVALLGAALQRDAMIARHARELEQAVRRAETNEALTRRHLDGLRLKQASEALDAGQVERAQTILAEIRSETPGGDPDVFQPGFAWGYLMSRARRELVAISDRRTERTSQLVPTPDGRRLVQGDEDGTILIRDGGTGRVERRLTGHSFAILRLVFSNDAHRLVSVGREEGSPRSEVFVRDFDSGRIVARLDAFASMPVAEARFDRSGRRLWISYEPKPGAFALDLWRLGDHGRPERGWTRPSRVAPLPLSPDGDLVALEEPAGVYRLQDVEGRTVGSPFRAGFSGGISGASRDGRRLAVASDDETIVWDAAEGREVARFRNPGRRPWRIQFRADGEFLACDFGDAAFALHDLRAKTSRVLAPEDEPIHWQSATVFSPDGALIAHSVSGGPGGRSRPIQIRRVEDWSLVASYPGVRGLCESFAFAPDGRSLLMGIDTQGIRWRFAPARPSPEPAGHKAEAWSVAFASDDAHFATGGDDTNEPRTIRVWNTVDGREVLGWHGGVGTAAAIAFRPRSSMLASGHLGSSDVRLWNVATGERLAVLSGHSDSVRTLAFSPDGTRLATAGSDRSIRIWSIADRRLLHVLEGHSDTARQVAFSPDGSLLASVANDRTVSLWDPAKGVLLRRLPWVEKLACVAFDPGGETLVAADELGMIPVWDVATGRRVRTIQGDVDELHCLAFSPTGGVFATGGLRGVVRLWDVETGQELLAIKGSTAQVNGLAFSGDGSMLAVCRHDGSVRLLRSDDWRRID